MERKIYQFEDMLLNKATNYDGNIDESIKNDLFDYMVNPTQEKWVQIYSVIINGAQWITLWNAVTQVVPDFQTSLTPDENNEYLWERIPTKEEIVKALAYAIPKDGKTSKYVKKPY